MTSTTDLPARYCTLRVEIPVMFEVTMDTDTDLGRQAYDHLRANTSQVPAWLNGALDVAFTLANARGDDKTPAITIDAHICDEWHDLSDREVRDLDTAGNVISV